MAFAPVTIERIAETVDRLRPFSASTEINVRLPRVTGGGIVDPSRLNRLCLLIELADLHGDETVLSECRQMLETALSRNVKFTVSWPFSIRETLDKARDQ